MLMRELMQSTRDKERQKASDGFCCKKLVLITRAVYAKRPVSMPAKKYRTNIFIEEAASGKKLKLRELVKAKEAKNMKSTHIMTNQDSSEV
jgi:hypothetical protein